MVESVMGQARDTWLRSECIALGNSIVDLQTIPNSIIGFLVEGKIDLANYMLTQFQIGLKSLVVTGNGKIGSDTEVFYNRAYNAIGDYESGKRESAIDILSDLSEDLRIIMYEKVVECQCGKSR